VRNFGESDTDCGRVCKDAQGFGLCGLRQRCDGDEDCQSFVCREIAPGAGKVCVECDDDARCQLFNTDRRRCIENFCFECAADFDCPPARRFCIAASGCPNNEPCACGTCRVDDDCPPGQVCDELGRCFECFEDEDCAGKPNGPFCVDHACKACGKDADCPNAGDVCILNVCRLPATCPAERDLCTQGFGDATRCASGCRCHTTTENETRCVSTLEVDCRAQSACGSRAECESRFGAGAFCVRDTGNFCGCSFCARQCV
jgi:hypothetical protein